MKINNTFEHSLCWLQNQTFFQKYAEEWYLYFMTRIQSVILFSKYDACLYMCMRVYVSMFPCMCMNVDAQVQWVSLLRSSFIVSGSVLFLCVVWDRASHRHVEFSGSARWAAHHAQGTFYLCHVCVHYRYMPPWLFLHKTWTRVVMIVRQVFYQLTCLLGPMFDIFKPFLDVWKCLHGCLLEKRMGRIN